MYVILAYSKRVSKRVTPIYLMQYQFIPSESRLCKDNLFENNESGLAAIREVVRENYSYLERVDHRFQIKDNFAKPSLSEDWNEYALQRLVQNDLPKYESCIVAYNTDHKDITTLRFR